MSKIGRGHGHGGHGVHNHWNHGFDSEKLKKAQEEEAVILVDGRPKVVKIGLTDGINTKEGINSCDYKKAKYNKCFDDDCHDNGKKVGHHRKEAEAEAARAEEEAKAEAEAQAKAEQEAQAKAEEAKQAEIKQEELQEQKIQEERRDDIKDESFKTDFRREDQQDAELRNQQNKSDGLKNEIKYQDLNFKTFDLKKTKPRSVASSHSTPVSNNANTNAVKTVFSDSSVHTSISHRDIEGELKKERNK
jgi:membrane protein involved in colicin uptake